MKRTLLAILLVLVATHAMAATDVKLAWDAMPSGETWTEVRVYEKANTAYSLLGTVTTPATVTTFTVANVAVGLHTYVVRSWNGQQESVDSNSVTVTILVAPIPPGHLTMTVVVR